MTSRALVKARIVILMINVHKLFSPTANARRSRRRVLISIRLEVTSRFNRPHLYCCHFS